MLFPGELYLLFEPYSIKPNDGNLITDGSKTTCAAFESDTEKYTKFRFPVQDVQAEWVNVTLRGTDLGCGRNLYVTPLSAAETETWLGLWTLCKLENVTTDGEKCLYLCHCKTGCKEIQVMKVPSNIQETAWTLCHICTQYPSKGMLTKLFILKVYTCSGKLIFHIS